MDFTGDLQNAFGYALSNPHALTLMVVYTFLAYIAITFHMALVQEFGGITTGDGARMQCDIQYAKSKFLISILFS